jgi:putative membrane protein
MMFFGGWMIIVWIIVIGLIIWGIIALVRYNSSAKETSQKRDPIDIAKERYARGEITREEYERIKKDLM